MDVPRGTGPEAYDPTFKDWKLHSHAPLETPKWVYASFREAAISQYHGNLVLSLKLVLEPYQTEEKGHDWHISEEWANTLVDLYLTNFHALYPIVEENQLVQFRSATCELTKDGSILLFYAVIFVAFGYINQTQLQLSHFKFIHEGQKFLFEQAEALYHYSSHQHSDITLTQVAFLLSNWGPYDGVAERNCAWICRALSHATSAGLNKGARSLNHRLIWMCCLIRGRILALPVAMKSSSWITGYEAEKIERKDFEEGCTTGAGNCLQATPLLAEAFILFANMSDMLNKVISLRERQRQQKYVLSAEVIPLWELQEVLNVAHSVDAWEKEWSSLLNECNSSLITMHLHTMYHTLGILKETILIELYQPYITLAQSENAQTIDILTTCFSILALTQLEKSANGIATHVRELLEHSAEDKIPLMIATWLPCPIFVFLLKLHTESIHSRSAFLKPFGDLFRLLFRLRSRFSGAGFVSALLDELMKSLQNRLTSTSKQQALQETRSVQLQRLSTGNNEQHGPQNMFTRNQNLAAFPRWSSGSRPKASVGQEISKAEILAWGLHAIRESFSMKQVRVL